MRFLSLVLLMTTLLLTVSAVPVLATEEYSPGTIDIARKLLCPVCSGETVADSQSGTARAMREAIEQKVQAGESEQQILDFFVARYGESILTDPPKSGFVLTLWWLPVLVVLVGALAVGLYLRERTRMEPVAAANSHNAEDAELEAIADEVLSGRRAQRSAGTSIERGEGLASP